ncbi:Cro/Cl family transcriptional regulator [Bacillus sp. FJAT-27916]|nr:Cro/Cl family transcriptional regulator [Bacillus sp. FJAT-27916]
MKAGITQAKLAEAAGITRQTVGLNEKGAYHPPLKLCLLICYAVNATIGELFWVDEEDSERRKYRMNG